MVTSQIHGNPGDYAWGRGGLDAIITQVQGDTLIMTVFFWYLVKSELSSVRVYSILHWQISFTRYQNNTAMFIWPGCNRALQKEIEIINKLCTGSLLTGKTKGPRLIDWLTSKILFVEYPVLLKLLNQVEGAGPPPMAQENIKVKQGWRSGSGRIRWFLGCRIRYFFQRIRILPVTTDI